MSSPLVLPVAAAISIAVALHSLLQPHALVTIVICAVCVAIHFATASRPSSVACCANTAFALAAAGAAGVSHAMASDDSANFGMFVAVVAVYHCGEFFAIALSKPADVDNFGDGHVWRPIARYFNPLSVVNHSTAYAAAMMLAAVEYWCACSGALSQTSSCHPTPPAQVILAVLPRPQAVLSPHHATRRAPRRPCRRPPKGRDAVRSSALTGIRAALMRVCAHCRQAGRSFTHLIAKSKVDGHVLVTSGRCPLCKQHAVPVTRAMVQGFTA